MGAVLFTDYILTAGIEGTAGMICSVCFLVMGVWMLCTMFYTFPLQAQFYNTVKQTLINAMILATRKIVTTVAVFALNILPVVVAFGSFAVFVRTLPVWVLLAPGLIAYLCSLLFVKIFDPLIQSAQQEEAEENA